MDREAPPERRDSGAGSLSKTTRQTTGASAVPDNPRLSALLRFIGLGVLFNGLIWFFGFFVDMRGWISVSASYIALAGMWVVGFAIILALAAQTKISHKRLVVFLASALWTIALWGLDRSASPQESSHRAETVPDELTQPTGPTEMRGSEDFADNTPPEESPATEPDADRTISEAPTESQSPSIPEPRADEPPAEPKSRNLDEPAASAPPSHNRETAVPELTLPKLFEDDFSIPGIFAAGFNPRRLRSSSGNSVMVGRKLVYDKNSLSKYVAFFVPFYLEAFSVCEFIAMHHQELTPGLQVGSQYPGEAFIPPEDFSFHGRIIVYHEDLFTIQQLATLEKLYESRDLKVQFRGPGYLQTQRYIQQQQR